MEFIPERLVESGSESKILDSYTQLKKEILLAASMPKLNECVKGWLLVEIGSRVSQGVF
jgi:hypothetical protein